jgi:tetratricopeptide (TPR) repeat protein
MKFIKNLKVLALLVTALLAGCTSFQSTDEQVVTSDTPQAEVLSQIQTKVLALKAEPNLYQTQNKLSPPAATIRQFKQALALKNQGEITKAKTLLQTIAEQNPNLSGVWLQLGLLAKQQNEDAANYLNNAVAVNPHNYIARNELALLLRQKGEFNQALNHYNAALKSWPAFAEAYLNRGILYDLYLGEKTNALADYELYQALQTQESRQLKGWIIDLQRQIKSAQSGGV